MTRNKIIFYIAAVLVVVLALAFGAQVRRLQKQLPAAVRIIPSDSKSRSDGGQDGAEENAGNATQRPEVLVKFRAGISSDQINQIASRFNDQLQDEIEAVPGLTSINDRDDGDAAAVAAQYRALPEVEYAEPNCEIEIDQRVANRQRLRADRQTEQWAFSRIALPEAWKKTTGSNAVVVGVLDSGVEYTHVGLVNNIWTRPAEMMPYHDQDLGTIDDVHGYNAVANDGDPLDDIGHGTACAGIIGGYFENRSGSCGINQQVAIMPLKFVNAGGFGSTADAIEAINYAIDRRRAGVNLRVINVGWELAERSRALEETIRAASAAGILFVVSSGSDGANNESSPRYPANYSIGNIISVAATSKNDVLAQSSNYGPDVQLAAPGEDVLTTALGNEYELRSGTSMAASLVTGVAALTLSVHPDLAVDQLRARLLESVDKLPALQGKVTTGGRINALKAVSK
jgi:subtilisin family serine protease